MDQKTEEALARLKDRNLEKVMRGFLLKVMTNSAKKFAGYHLENSQPERADHENNELFV